MSSRHEDMDLEYNHKDETPAFTQMIEKSLSRRDMISGSVKVGMGGLLTASPLSTAIAQASENKLMSFAPVAATSADTITLPKGYSWQRLISWGDPLFKNAPEFDHSGNNTAADQELQFGDNNDGMSLFPINKRRAVMAVNNEYCNYEYLFNHDGKNLSADDVRKAQAAHGVSVFEVRSDRQGNWTPVLNSKYNRRIHVNTEMELTGPVAGHDLVKTTADPTGTKVFGTMNNCGNGETPWGTYLTCEENFNGYFGSSDESSFTDDHKRYGLRKDGFGYMWHQQDERFDVAKHPNEPNRFGWIVEIDPMDPKSTPKKRTALGRFKHENAALHINKDGHVVVYLGDDERGEFLYKFVSEGKYDPNNKANGELLAEGTLYVAKFNAAEGALEGRGQWIELNHGKNGLTAANGFADQADVLVHARRAATHVGATTMDRPEWVAVHPSGKSAFCTLTNNKNRGVKDNQPVGGPNPREKNNYGQIVRWFPMNEDHTSDEFVWDLYVVAGNPTTAEGLYKGSENVNADNMFNSPDGIAFDTDGRLWIQTDGNYSNDGQFAGMGNNQMLVGDPVSGEIRRFMVGPVACEVTGICWSPDKRTMFVGIQHPGEDLKSSHWPEGSNKKPRSTVIAVRREDGGIIGS